VLDSRRCISYLTIEHKDTIPDELTTLIDDWVFGCDVCQDVCPWNISFAHPADDPALGIDPGLAQLDLENLATISETDFRERYGCTPLERPGITGMRRNATIAMRNLRRHTSPALRTP
jgi:epoxyqueuosine reductase